MKPQISESLQVALHVLKHIDLNKKAADEFIHVIGYENGREHGLALITGFTYNRRLTICWSECRNSDQIVVYVSKPGEQFDRDTNIPTERAYKAATYFGYNEYERAAKFISRTANTATK